MRTARLLTVSQHALGRGCLPGGRGVCLGAGVCPVADTPPWTDRHLWKHNLRKLRLRAVMSHLCDYSHRDFDTLDVHSEIGDDAFRIDCKIKWYHVEYNKKDIYAECWHTVLNASTKRIDACSTMKETTDCRSLDSVFTNIRLIKRNRLRSVWDRISAKRFNKRKT